MCPPQIDSNQLEKVEADLKDARRRGSKLTAELSKLSQDAARLQAQAEQATTRAKDLIAAAALEQVMSCALQATWFWNECLSPGRLTL